MNLIYTEQAPLALLGGSLADVPSTLEGRVAAVEAATHFQDHSADIFDEVEDLTNMLRTRVGVRVGVRVCGHQNL